MLTLWAVVLVSNLLGACLFGLAIAKTGVFDEDLKGSFDALAAAALGSPSLTFLRGIFAGWLIALMVWLLPLSESNRLHTVVVMTYVVALGGFSHIVAGSVDVSYGAFRGLYSWSEFPRFLLPTLAGNMLGGLALVTALNYRQVVTGNDGAEPSSHLRRAG